MNSSKTKRKPDQRSIYLTCSPIIHLRAVEQSDYKVSIIEMGFTAGEYFEFGFWAQMIDVGLGDQVVRENVFKLCAMSSYLLKGRSSTTTNQTAFFFRSIVRFGLLAGFASAL
jgi:hypothetical protein